MISVGPARSGAHAEDGQDRRISYRPLYKIVRVLFDPSIDKGRPIPGRSFFAELMTVGCTLLS